MRLCGIVLALVFISTLATGDEQHAKPVTPEAAAKKVSEKCTVEMEVKSTGKGNGVFFLNSKQDFRDATNFTVFINKASVEKLKEAKIEDPATYFKNQRIKVTGTVQLYRDKPEIIVEKAEQIQVIEKKQMNLQFDKNDVGKLPKGWTADKTGKGEGSVWKVVADDTAPSKKGYVLAQTAESPGALFNICVVDDTIYTDVEVSVAFKAVKGDRDQGGGIVWRYQDADNYYIARMNPLEDNYRLYKVVAGKRIQLTTKEDLKVPIGTWHTLRIKMTGDQIECHLDGKKYLEGKDGAFTKAGKVGLWTKADAQTYFDDLRISGK
jgi:DNA/RNA endonuclease YhcR with UshA esterase domain